MIWAAAAGAQAPAGAPAGSTGICKDGTYYSGATKSGACRGHKGIQTWYADVAGASAAKTAPAATKPAAAAAAATKPTPAAPTVAKAGSGPAPAGATGVCKDGSYWTGPTKSGACRGHQGIQTWYADAGGAAPVKPSSMPAPAPAPAAAAPSRPAPTPAAQPAPAMPAPAANSASTSAAARKGPAAAASAKPLAPGGGPGLVWVNTESKVYHCNGDGYYGKTKAGQYMTEAAAQAAGARGDRGKTCAGK